MIYPGVEGRVDFVEGLLEWRIGSAETWKCGSESRPQDAIVEAGEEQRRPEAECGDAVSKAIGQAFDQAVETQAAQLVGDCALSDRLRIAAGQSGKVMTQIG